jgi:hypothetical protein
MTHHETRSERHSDRWRPLGAGLAGGALGTVVMSAFRAPTARSLPPTADFLSRWGGGSPEKYPLASLVLHLLYGVAAGVPLGLAWPRLAAWGGDSERVGLLVGAAYGLVLSVFGERVVVGRLVGMTLDDDESAVFHAGHLVYGLTLGAWVGSRARS